MENITPYWLYLEYCQNLLKFICCILNGKQKFRKFIRKRKLKDVLGFYKAEVP
jgi:hypothetical protein